MTFGSLFAGIGGFDLGFERAGMTCKWQVEIDKNAQAVLKKHFPNATVYDDVRTIGKHNLANVDVLCGGFPCQDVSVAGKREGLAGKRSGLWYEFQRVIGEIRPRIVCIENVAGLLSNNEGRDFAAVIFGLVELGYRVCWRVLDSRYFGVPQRRRRVFIVGSLGNGSCAEILFERESLRGGSAESREARETIAGTIEDVPGSGSGKWQTLDQEYNVMEDCVGCLKASSPTGGGFQPIVFDKECGSGHGFYAGGISPTLRVGKTPAVAFHFKASTEQSMAVIADCSPTLLVGKMPAVSAEADNWRVRRFTPMEQERLQGFDDDWTGEYSDTSRYRMTGNAVTVNVAEWIGRRIMEAYA